MAVIEPALRKRQQIAYANRVMFTWVAVVSAVVGFAIVGIFFLAQKLVFNEKVLAVKQNTASTLSKNNDAVAALKDQIRVLNTNQNLINAENSGDSQPSQVVLDALPSQDNPSALLSSLQNSFLNDNRLTILSLATTTTSTTTTAPITSSSPSSTSSPQQIPFSFSVSVQTSNVDALRVLLQHIESSIRAIDLTNITLENSNTTVTLTAQGVAYYQPPVNANLQNEVVRP